MLDANNDVTALFNRDHGATCYIRRCVCVYKYVTPPNSTFLYILLDMYIGISIYRRDCKHTVCVSVHYSVRVFNYRFQYEYNKKNPVTSINRVQWFCFIFYWLYIWNVIF